MCSHRWRMWDVSRLLARCLDCRRPIRLETLPRSVRPFASSRWFPYTVDHRWPDDCVYADVDWTLSD